MMYLSKWGFRTLGGKVLAIALALGGSPPDNQWPEEEPRLATPLLLADVQSRRFTKRGDPSHSHTSGSTIGRAGFPSGRCSALKYSHTRRGFSNLSRAQCPSYFRPHLLLILVLILETFVQISGGNDLSRTNSATSNFK